MARQHLRVRVSETTCQRLDTIRVAEIAHITQQEHRHLWILLKTVTIWYDMIDDLHWKTDRQAASLI